MRFLRKAEVILILNAFFFVILNLVALKLMLRNSYELSSIFVLYYVEAVLFPVLWICSIVSYFIIAKRLNQDKSFLAFIFAALAYPVIFVIIVVVLTALSNFKDSVTKKTTIVPSQSTATIINLSVMNDCNIAVSTTEGPSTIETNFRSVMKAPGCPNMKPVLSTDKKFAAVQSVSGGIDGAISVYSVVQDKSWQLTVLGSADAIDLLFLPNNRLAVLESGAPDAGERPLWVTVYNLNDSSSISKDPIPPTKNVAFDQTLVFSDGVLKVIET
ncbi:MAG TPA: hypothetical protein VLI92_03110, partial [Candidatus Saccharimonadales bacterium]|nr:hypothetical protein [Candidatus Saccharimonadales bacterium]